MSTSILLRPLDESTRMTLADVVAATGAIGIHACLIGAQARVIWLEHVHGLKAGRATEDTDFAIQVEDWAQFEALSRHLTDHCSWFRRSRQGQRFVSSSGRIVDLVPCGGVAVDDPVTLPPDHTHRMDVRGFELAVSESVGIEYGEGQRVRIAPLHILVLLKLVSWWDREIGKEKDAQDLVTLLRSYADTDADNLLALDAHLGLYDAEDDQKHRGARLVGRLIASAADDATLALVRAILADELDEDGSLRLVSQVAPAMTGDPAHRAQVAFALISALLRGLDEGS